jgi:predicted nucleic acid-binding protein
MAASILKRVCWDACAWISLIQKEKIRDASGTVIEDRYGLCRVVVELAEKGKIEIVTSGLSLAEVCKSPAVKGGPADQIGPYFENDWILVVPLDTLVGTTARALMLAGHAGLKPPDAVHLATAIIANADELHTFDRGLLNLDEQVARLDGNMLKICKPSVAAVPAPLLESATQADKRDNDADDTA